MTARADGQAILPQGGTVASGQVTIAHPAGSTLTINQSSSKAIVDWNSFSVGANASVNIVQPNSSAAILNRVTGATPSTIAGQINANGQVFLVNPNGIAITPTGSVQVGGGFVASTLDIGNADFNAGKLNFAGKGASAAVSNAGSISGAPGSFVGLIGGSVSNSGTISVPLGRVGLGAGEKVTLDPTGDGFLQVTVPTGATTADGKALIDVSGRIRAAGGSVQIKAATAQQAVRDVVNVSGSISARSVRGRPGNIVLDGGGGAVTVSGRLAANGGTRSKGGTIVVTGNKVALTSTARVTANGASGGSVLIGGDLRGGTDPAVKLVAGPVRNAETTSIAQGATISANGTAADGGNVVVWSDALTDFRGSIAATGGAGMGGAVEVSSHGVLGFRGSVDVTATSGETGTLLLDPFNVTISAGSDTSIANVANNFTPTGNSSILSVATLQAALATANITVSTGGGGAQSGDITVADAVTWSSGNSLALNAAGAIAINAPITASSGALSLSAGSSIKAITATAAISVGSLTISRGAWSQNTASLPGLYAGSFSIGSNASFLRAAGGSGTGGSPYLLTDIYGVQGIGSSTAYLANSYALINDVDASTTAAWNGGAGFKPIGSVSGTGYGGTFDGNNHAIADLTINRSGVDGVGLFGYVNTATIQNLYLLNANVAGGSAGLIGHGSGTLVGVADSSTIQHVTVTGTMTATGGGNNFGGIVGDLNSGSLLQYSSAAVDVTSAHDSTGGAVGAVESGATVQYVSATGKVSAPGEGNVGGLVGWNVGTISDSYATGDVSGGAGVGGLVGFAISGTISTSYSSGAVSGGNGFVGGHGSVTFNNDYWDTQTSGHASGGASGVSGLTTAQMLVSGNFSGFDFATVWYQSSGYYPTLRGATTIVGPAQVSSGGNLTISTAADTTRSNVGATTNVNTTSLQDLLGFGNVLVSTASGTLGVIDDVTWGSSSLRLASSSPLTIGANLTSGSGGDLGLTSSAISVNGNAINLGGALSAMGVASGASAAVSLSNTAISVGSGSSSIAGISANGHGVDISGTTSLSASTGSLAVSGTSQAASIVFGSGIHFASGSALSTLGTVTLTGTGGTTGNAHGIALESGASIVSSGALTLQGTTDSSVSNRFGLYLVGNNTVTATLGSVTMTGTAASSGLGINVNSGTLTLANNGAGSFSITGTGVSNTGLNVASGAGITTAGSVTLSGLSDSGTGLALQGGNSITALSGNLTLSGQAASGQGAFSAGANTLTNSGIGSFTVSGTSDSDNGVFVFSGSSVTTSGTVALSGLSNSSVGFYLLGGNTITNNVGTLTISGASTSNQGVWFNGGTNTLIDSGAGLSLSGTSSTLGGLALKTNTNLVTSGTVSLSGTSISDSGVLLDGPTTITDSAGNLTISGTSTIGIGFNFNSGANSLTNSGGGALVISGATSSNIGLQLNTNAGLTTAGSLTLNGTSNTGTGVIFNTSSTFNVSSGDVTVSGLSSTISGTGAAIGTRFADASVTNSGSGSLAITGISNDAGSQNSGSAGVLISGSSSLANSGGGSLSVSGTNASGYGTELGTAAALATSGTMSLSGTSTAGYGFFMGFASSVAASTGDLSLSGNSTSNIAMRLRGSSITNNGTGTLALSATGDTDLQVSISSSAGPLILSETGTMTQAAGTITAPNLLLSGGSGSFALNATGNAIDTLAANVGSLAVTDASALTIGTVAGTSGVTASASATLVTAGDLTLATGAPVSAASAVLSAAGAFINNAGSAAVTATSGRWLIYSNTPGGDTFGGLDSTNTALWNATYATLPPGSVSAAGNRYLFANQPTLTFTSTDATKTYGTDASAAIGSDYSVSGYQAGVSNAFLGDNAASTFTGGPAVTSTGAAAGATVAGSPYAMTIGPGSLAAVSGYAWAFNSLGTLSVTPAPVTVTALGGSSSYGSSPANPGLSAAGLQNGESVSVLTGLSNSFGISNTSNAGSYVLSVIGTLTNSNYTLAGTTNGSWTVNPAPVTVTALGGSSTYGASPANPGLSATGLQNGQSVSALTGLSNSFGISNTSNAGSYVLSVIGTLTNANYTVAGTTTGSWTVNPAPVTVTALGGSSTYGASPANPGLSATGLQNGESVNVLTGLSNSFGISNTSNAGSYVLSVIGTLTNANYTVAGTTTGSWTVNPAPVTVTALGGASTYGSSPANPGLSATGLQNGENVNVLTGLSNSFGISNTSNTGSYVLSVIGTLTNANYTVAGTTNGSWTVNPAPVTVTALGGASTYGSSPANPGLSAAGLQNGESVNVLTGLSNSFGISNTSNAGSYVLSVIGTLTNANYTVAGTTTGSWTVNPAPVTVTALGGSSTYGQSPANPGLSATGLQNGQSVSALTGLSNSFGIINTSNAGSHVLSVIGTLTNTNYTVAGTTTGGWTVNPAPVTVTALGGSSTYGQSPANPGLSATGLQNGEGASVLTGLSNSFGITGTSAIASFVMNVVGTLTNGNYTVVGRKSGTWNVTAAPFNGPSPADPNLSVASPSHGGGTGALNAFAGPLPTVNAGAPGGKSAAAGVDLSVNPSGLVAPPGSPSPRASQPQANLFAAPLAPVSAVVAGNAGTALQGGCGGKVGGSGNGAADGGGCAAPAAPKKAADVVDFVVSRLKGNVLAQEIGEQFSEIARSESTPRQVLMISFATASVALTVGLVGWLLRGGALLSAFLSSMPLWRGFDPLVIVQRPHRNGGGRRIISRLDSLFDGAGATSASARRSRA